MADNVQFQSTQLATPADGTQVSTDEAASGHIQRVKLAYSADGIDTHVQADADGLRVNNGAHKDALSVHMELTDIGLASKSAIYGYSTAQGGKFEPVKVNPSGSLLVQASQEGSWNINNVAGTISLPTGAATEYSVAQLASNFSTALSSSNLRVVESGLSLPISSSAAETYSIDDQATSTTLLDANANRKGWAVYNDSTSTCYVKFGATASSTSFTVELIPDAYYEQMGHGVYTGRVDAIWASNASGAARVTEW
jgi:hypothetical protein